jgi:NNP family nitrate/nitrite transporter-like MFS transporter
MNRSFLKAGHPATLIAAFLYFDLSFMVWVMLGPLGVQIAKDLGLSAAQKGLMVATPVLAGALLRIVMGVLVDHLKPKMAGIIGQIIVMPVVRYLPEHQGTAPRYCRRPELRAPRWRRCSRPVSPSPTAGTTCSAPAVIPLLFAFADLPDIREDSPECPPAKSLVEYLKVLKDKDAWWFMFFYSVTFGGFVGLASSLTIYFNDQYGLSPVMAGYFTAACVFAGSLVRPIGGMVADRVGGIKSLSFMYILAAVFIGVVSTGLPASWMALTSSSSPCWRSAWVTARCSNWCRSASARRSV